MPATKDDIARLRGVLHMLQSERAFAAGHGEIARKETIMALERAIALLEEGAASSPVFWILGALSKAWVRKSPYRFVPIDHDLNQWALEQLHAQLGSDEASNEVH